jgi:hypothetical protein
MFSKDLRALDAIVATAGISNPIAFPHALVCKVHVGRLRQGRPWLGIARRVASIYLLVSHRD